MKVKYKCFMKLDSLLKGIRFRGFYSEGTKEWCYQGIVEANDLVAEGDYDQALILLQKVEDVYYTEYLAATAA
jgi:hypothetical protein